MSERTNLADIAKKLGLNKSTVSRALRRDPRISKATTRRVLELADELGYQRDPALSTLSEIRWRKSDNRSLMNWAFLITELAANFPENQIFRDYVIQFARKAGYTASAIVLKPEMTTAEVCRMIKARRIRGLIVNQIYKRETVPLLDFQEIEAAAEACVYCGNFFFEPEGHRVIEDVFASTLTALTKIQEKGFRKIAVLYHANLRNAREAMRQRSAAHLYQDEHPEVEIKIYEVTPDNKVPGFTGAEAMLSSHGVKTQFLPEVFQRMPNAVLRVAPNAVQVSGNIRPYEDLAATAVDMVDFQLRRSTLGIETKRHTILVEGKWQDGQTL